MSDNKKTFQQTDDTQLTKSKMPETIKGWIIKYKDTIKLALPEGMTHDRIVQIALSAVRLSPKLANCDHASFLTALMQSVQLGLEINTPLGFAFLIPYNIKGKLRAQFQIGYKGLIELAYRTGQYKRITAMEVYSEDRFDFEYGLFPKLQHIPADEQKGDPVKYYAIYELVNGGYDFKVWSFEKVFNHAVKYSQSWDPQKKDFRYKSGWADHFDSMAKKTVLKNLLDAAPKSVEFAKQVASDQTVKEDFSRDMSDVVAIWETEDDQFPEDITENGNVENGNS